jgi:hypothetical protein
MKVRPGYTLEEHDRLAAWLAGLHQSDLLLDVSCNFPVKSRAAKAARKVRDTLWELRMALEENAHAEYSDAGSALYCRRRVLHAKLETLGPRSTFAADVLERQRRQREQPSQRPGT